ncbi:alpha/beta hydrolase [Halopelagius fulvigenes]|uniref:Alpha/beta hydrolase n=1 Tax=Halopelagius fulvigenes TaxID=1198324 RepID=A0ABD5U062_9EURY
MADGNAGGSAADPHGDQPIRTAGESLESADAAVVLVHGRGATARGMLQFAEEFHREGLAYVAPQAQRGTWYPNRFLAPIDANEPHLASALGHVDSAVETVEDAGIPAEKTLIVGFSQGACLSSEYVARNARRYGGLGVLAGGLIGPEGTPRDYDGSLDGTPVFLGVSDDDPHIPLERAEETVETLERMDADVTFEVYEGLGHGIFPDEVEHVRELVAGVLDG